MTTKSDNQKPTVAYQREHANISATRHNILKSVWAEFWRMARLDNWTERMNECLTKAIWHRDQARAPRSTSTTNP
jgi:hypothetical protein